MKPSLVIVKPGEPRRVYGELSDFDWTAIELPFWSAKALADATRFKTQTGWRAEVSLQEGIDRTIRGFSGVFSKEKT